MIKTSRDIVESISDKLEKEKIFEIISRTYFSYKEILQFIKELTVYKKYVFENEKYQISLDLSNESNENEEELAKFKKRETRSFEEIKCSKQFKDLLKKENKIRKDFHGNRDFINLIKGIAIELARLGDINDNEKVPIVVQYIERNFGGINYEIDIDLKLTLEDTIGNIKLIENILEDYELYSKNI